MIRNHTGANGHQTRSCPRLDILTDSQCEQIHWASLKILERTGVDVRLPEALELLENAGADARDPGHVRIPAHMVEAALAKTPHRMTIYDRKGAPAMDLEGRNCHYGTGTETPFVIDSYSGERRATRGEDVDRAARVADALPNIDFVAAMGSVNPAEVPSHLSDGHNFARMLANTTKPILFTAWDARSLADIHAMAVSVCGDDEAEFAGRPFIIQYVEPISPLCHPAASLEKLLYCVRNGVPVTYASGTMMGGTVPVTAAGALAVTNAEFLSALTVAQLARPGAGVIYGGCSGPLDMQTGVCIYNGPDAYQSYHMTRELAAWYDLPDFNYGGCSDAKTLDLQAAAEATFSIFQAGLAGYSLVHDVGYLESGMSTCLELIVLADELIDQVRHFKRLPVVDAETLALEAIDQVGPGGNFTDHAHTLRHFRGTWYPRMSDRRNHENWRQAGGLDFKAILTQKVHKILEQHRPEPLAANVQTRIQAILDRAANGGA